MVTQAVLDSIHVGAGILTLSGSGGTTVYELSDGGATLNISKDLEFLEVDQHMGKLEAYIVAEDVSFEISSVQFDAGLLGTAAGGAGSTFGGELDIPEYELQYEVEGRTGNKSSITITLYRVVPDPDLQAQFAKNEPTTYPATFTALQDLNREPGSAIGAITIGAGE